MALIHDNVFDAALSYISTNAVEAEIHDASDVALVDAVTLDGNNFSAAGDNGGAGGGRKITCLASDSSDMKNIAVDTGGDATVTVLKNVGGDILIETDISSAPVTLGSFDQVNLGTFDVILKDPT